MSNLLTSGISLYDLPAQVQDDVFHLRRVFDHIVKTGEPATRHLQKLCSGQKSRSVSTLYRILGEWIESGKNDLVLVDKRKFPSLWQRTTESALPAEFLDWVAGRMLGNQRKSKPAYRDVIKEWKAWRRTGRRGAGTFPGYDTAPPPSDIADHPVGWSYKNLMDQCALTKAELVMARQGTAAASKHLPFIPSTREGVRWLEYVLFDDVHRDRNVCTSVQIQPCRLLQLGCLDLASGVYLKFGQRPDILKDDGSGTRDRLKRRDMLLLVASLLLEHGYPLDYPMHLVVERATATLTKAEAELLYDLSGGQIRVGWTSMEGQFVLAWDESKSGNPDAKGALESWHNLLHNYDGSRNGQVGKDRDHSPASLYGSNREAVALNTVGLVLTREQRSELRLPYSSADEAYTETLDDVLRMNTRRDHCLEGHGMVLLWRLPNTGMDWQPEALLLQQPPDVRNNVEYLPAKESPLERALRLSAECRIGFIPPGALVRFYEDSHTPATVERRQVTFKHAGKRYYFGAESAEEMTLPEGSEVVCHHDPLDPKHVLVTHRGIFIGIWRRQLVRKGDQAALAKATHQKLGYLNQTAASVRGKMREKLEREARRADHNLEVLAKADLVPTSALADLATGREIVVTDVAAGMARAVQEIRKTTADSKSAERAQADLEARASRALAKQSPQSPPTPDHQNHEHIDY